MSTSPPRATARRSPPASVDQTEVIAWLATPSAYGLKAGPIERIDTHTSVVFLAGDSAFKLKRAVRFDYLDYSTPERRRWCCLEEVRLNRRTAPELYRGVRDVRRAPDGRLALDGRGHAIDHVVEMTRFDADAQLDRLAARHALDRALMPRLADAVVRLHEVAERNFDYGGHAGMSAELRGVRKALRTYGRGVLDLEAAERLSAASQGALRRRADLLDARRAHGLVRHGHGDLHLRNICLRDGQPVLFDCIEFNPAFARVDVLYDLAFLLMDLLHRGLASHANAVLNRYIERMEDIDGLVLLPLFLATRASIRAMANATAVPAQSRAEHAAALRVEARQYLELAQTLISPPPPILVAVGGPSGAGKTTLARRLAASIGPAPGALVVRSDIERKRLLGLPIDQRLAPSGYTTGMSRDVYRTLVERAGRVLQAGHGVILDAVFANPVERAALRDAARANRVPFRGPLARRAPEDPDGPHRRPDRRRIRRHGGSGGPADGVDPRAGVVDRARRDRQRRRRVAGGAQRPRRLRPERRQSRRAGTESLIAARKRGPRGCCRMEQQVHPVVGVTGPWGASTWMDLQCALPVASEVPGAAGADNRDRLGTRPGRLSVARSAGNGAVRGRPRPGRTSRGSSSRDASAAAPRA